MIAFETQSLRSAEVGIHCGKPVSLEQSHLAKPLLPIGQDCETNWPDCVLSQKRFREKVGEQWVKGVGVGGWSKWNKSEEWSDEDELIILELSCLTKLKSDDTAGL